MKKWLLSFLVLSVAFCSAYSQSPCSSAGTPTITFGGTIIPGISTTTTPTFTWTVTGAKPTDHYDIYISRYPFGTANNISNYDTFFNSACSSLSNGATSYTIPSGRLVAGMLYRWNMDVAPACLSSCFNLFLPAYYFYIPPVISASGPVNICSGGSVTLTTISQTPGAGASVSYQWYKDGTAIPGATSTSCNATIAGDYTVKLSYSGSSAGNATIGPSNIITVSTTASPNTPANPTSGPISGGSITLTRGTPPGGETWYWQGASCGTSTALGSGSTNNVNSSGTYYIRALNSTGCWSASCGSSTVWFPPSITPPINISPGKNVLAGTGVTFSANISNSPTSVIWTFTCSNPNGNGTANSGSSSSLPYSLNVPGYYTVTVRASNPAGSSNSISTNFTVNKNGSNQALPPHNYVIQQNYPSCKIADPINTSTGSYEYKHTDINIPAINTYLHFTRYYSTVNAAVNSSLGYGWSHSYDYYVINRADTIWDVHYGDGHVSTFIPLIDGNGSSFALYGGTFETLYKNPSTGYFTLTFKSGEVYEFNSNNKLAAITDLNGNETTLNYSGGNLSSVVAPGGRSLTFTYNASRIVTITDPIGRTINYTYNTNGDPVQAINPNGGITGYGYTNTTHLITQITTPRNYTLVANTYDNLNRVVTQTDAYSQQTTIAYNTPTTGDVTITYPGNKTTIVHHDNFYRLTSETDELNHPKLYSYDYNNYTASATDGNGNRINYTNDGNGNRLTTTKPMNITDRILYNSFNKPAHVINPLNDSTSFTYDTKANILSVTLPGNALKTYTYYSNGLLHTSADALNHTTTYSYNSFGDLIAVVSPAGTRTYTYDSAGRRKTETDENNHTTAYTYNKNDMVVMVSYANNTSITDSFDADNNLVFSTDKKGYRTAYTYDNKDRLTSTVNPLGRIKTFSYDVRDNLTGVTDENNHTVSYGYDAKNRLISKTTSLGTVKYGYDNAGNKIADTGMTGQVKVYIYDSLNRMTVSKDEMGNQTSFSYDGASRLTSLTDPMGGATTYAYNKLGLITGVGDANGHGTSVSYDDNGNRLSITDPNGHTQYFYYNNADRLIRHTDAGGNTDSFGYDGAGNLISERKATGGTIVRIYDSVNRVKTVTNTGGNNYNFLYDANDNLISETNNTGTSLLAYDSLNLLKQYTDMFGKVVQYTYDSVGNRRTIKYPGNLVVAYAYNNDNMMTGVTDWLSHTTNYYYDAVGRLSKMRYPNGDTCLYTYDNANRLASLTNIKAANIINRSVFTLNANGNRIQEQRQGPIPFHLTAASFQYTYGNDDRLLSDSVTAYTNNASGNRTAAGTTAYDFSVDDILNSVTTPSGTTAYSYDARGNRVERRQGGIARRFVLDLSGELAQVLQEQDTTGAVKAHYIYGLGLIARIDSANNTLYYHYDAQHNTVALSNDTGLVTDTYVYEPFGTLLKHTGNTSQPFTFLGEYGVQQETPSLYFVRARYYDAANGRFIGKDVYPASLMNPQTLNRYVYGLNAPLTNIDPTGLFSWSTLGISALQFTAGIGLAALSVLDIYGIVEKGAVGGTSGVVSGLSNYNDATKYIKAATKNLLNVNTAGYEWQTEEDFRGVFDYVGFDNNSIKFVTKLNGIASGFNDVREFIGRGENIITAAKYLSSMPTFASGAIRIDVLIILKDLLSIYHDVQVRQSYKCNN